MRQVFHNLLNNAFKFSKPGVAPVLTISSDVISINDTENSPESQHVRICIADNGIGFDEQYAEKVFSLFYRLNTKDAYEGSGIGLSITKRIVERHRGIITVNSTEGVGSTFVITLPRWQSVPEMVAGQQPATTQQSA